ncbi:alpha/beta hydrolase [Rhodococcus sp. D2-41]|uniref:Alpha/beta hydrolase n=1 Tax=Speluncibacter jeojiensis TaxID=2710754 RepID=A0A9X4LZQ8_9ACTN|nr:alpha/beta hydrolase fold domain-containing protein [Rhodococcus sp. D2-41]MDG3012525.1 alpha/beta hydrolase [Rhodococcus sp. D2-41]MDG3015358.1 alpha/beta hydrolase [Corynebacteriales bacterium D3-21]
MRLPYLPRPLVAAGMGVFYRLVLTPRLSWRAQRTLLDAGAVLQTVPSGVVVEHIRIGGRPAEKLTARGAGDPDTAVLYLHGGAYTIGSPKTHRSLAGHLARGTGAMVVTLDYRLAPEHRYPAAVDDAVAAYLELLERRGLAPERVAIVGDSAGGGLAAASARRLIDEHGIRPGALVLLSPWVDPADENAPAARDLVVSTGWSRPAARAYLGDASPTDPGFAPAHAATEGMPPTLIQVGTGEILYPQDLAYAEKLRAGGVEVTLSESTLWHVAQLQASLLRDAAVAVDEINDFLRVRLRHR